MNEDDRVELVADQPFALSIGALVERMDKQIEKWDDEEPREIWWGEQHLFLEARDILAAVNEGPAIMAVSSAAPTAQDDNGVRIEARDDDALTEVAKAILADEHPDGMGLFKDRVHMSIAAAERAVVKALRTTASRLSADHTAASPDVPRHE